MKIFITGVAGAIGSTLAEKLIEEGHTVYGLDNLSVGREEWIPKAVEFYKSDLEYVENTFDVLRGDIDLVVHCAAQKDVGYSIENPNMDAHENIIGSLRLLMAMKLYKVKKLIFLSSAGALYDTPNATTATTPNPKSPYGIAKWAVEKYIKFYSDHYGIDSVILRLSNVYGKKCNAGVVNIFCDLVKQNKPIKIYGGEQTRDFVHVEDVVESIVKTGNELGKCNESPYMRILNVSSGNSISISNLLAKISSLSGKPVSVSFSEPKKGEIVESSIANSLPTRVSLDTGIKGLL